MKLEGNFLQPIADVFIVDTSKPDGPLVSVLVGNVRWLFSGIDQLGDTPVRCKVRLAQAFIVLSKRFHALNGL